MSQLTSEEQEALFQLCRKVIEEKLFSKSEIEPKIDSPVFQTNKGAFVTLRKSGKLRGCIGTIEAIMPLKEVLEKMAYSSAFKDPRFPPLSKKEYPEVDMEIPILSQTREAKPEEVVVGKHGVIISHSFHKGLLLPQVAVEQNWDRDTFLDHTCMKASLPPDMWKKDAKIEIFEAEIFHEKEN